MRLLAAVLAILLTSGAAAADENYSLGIGKTLPLKDDGFSSIAGPGTGLSLEYYHQFSWVLGLGFDADYLPFKSKTANLGFAKETGSFKAYELSAIARVSPLYGDSPVEPFAVAGLGFNSFSGTAVEQLNPGYVWADTGTTEQRSRHGTSQGVVYVIGGGLDYFLADKNLTVGLDARWHFFAISQSQFDSQWAKAATIMLRFGFRLPD